MKPLACLVLAFSLVGSAFANDQAPDPTAHIEQQLVTSGLFRVPGHESDDRLTKLRIRFALNGGQHPGPRFAAPDTAGRYFATVKQHPLPDFPAIEQAYARVEAAEGYPGAKLGVTLQAPPKRAPTGTRPPNAGSPSVRPPNAGRR
jgi:hypothetical protein